MEPELLQDLTWVATGGRGHGLVEVSRGKRVEVIVHAGRRDRAVAAALARLALAQVRPRLDEARFFAARRLLEYYNYFNAHIKNGEQLDEAQFAARLELEAIVFSKSGRPILEFRHDLYRGDRNWEGGMILVMARVDGELRRAAWVTAADAADMRQRNRVTPPRS